jgi:hypothetical protein
LDGVTGVFGFKHDVSPDQNDERDILSHDVAMIESETIRSSMTRSKMYQNE